MIKALFGFEAAELGYVMKPAEKPKSANYAKSAFGLERPINPSSATAISPAHAACLNVTSRGLDPQFWEDAALAMIKGNHRAFSRLIRTGAKKVRVGERSKEELEEKTYDFRTDLTEIPAAYLREAYATPSRAFKGPVSHAGHVARKLSRRADSEIVAAFEGLLGIKHEEHGDELDSLRRQHPSVYSALIGGFPTAALERARTLGNDAFAFTSNVVENHLIFLIVASAHLRLHGFKLSNTHPLGSGFSGNRKWLFLAEVSKASLIGPAKILQQLLGLKMCHDMSDSEAVSALMAANLLPNNDDGKEIVAKAKHIRGCVPEHALSRQPFGKQLSWIRENTRPVSLLTKDVLAEAQFTRTNFTQWLFKVSAPEAAVILSIELLCVRPRIKACIKAITKGYALPVAQPDGNAELGANTLSRLTEALRVEGQSDKNATPVLAPVENHNCKKLVQKTRQRISNGEVAPALTALLLDPAFYFRRKIDE